MTLPLDYRFMDLFLQIWSTRRPQKAAAPSRHSSVSGEKRQTPPPLRSEELDTTATRLLVVGHPPGCDFAEVEGDLELILGGKGCGSREFWSRSTIHEQHPGLP